MANFAQGVLETVTKTPEKICLVVAGRSATYGELHIKISTFYSILKKGGLKPNDRVLITVRPSVEFYALTIAVLAAGGAVVLVNIKMELKKINHCVTISKSAMWIIEKGSWQRWLSIFVPALKKIPIQLEVDCGAVSYGNLLTPDEVEAVDHSLVTFTTGSTGMPKLLMRKHDFILNQCKAIDIGKRELDPKWNPANDVSLTNLPVFLLETLKTGATGILHQNIHSFNPADVVAVGDKYDINLLGGSPSFVERLAEYCLTKGRKLPGRRVIVGGAPVYRRSLQKLMDASEDPSNVYVLYGSTEAEPISIISGPDKMAAEELCKEGLCAGTPIFKGSVKIIKPSEDDLTGDSLEDLEVPLETPGEIVVTGWHVNTYQVGQKRIVCDADGKEWLRTEDCGYLDNQGRLWLTGRVKWIVKKADTIHWSFNVERMVLDAFSEISFATYLCHEGRAILFVEAPKGLLPQQLTKLESFLKDSGVYVDQLKVLHHIKRDQRHASKPDTAALLQKNNLLQNRFLQVFLVVLEENTSFVLMFILLAVAIILYFFQ